MGFVVDMFDFSFVRFAVFNVADMFICFGAVFLCTSLIFRPDDWRRKGEKAQAS
jgi:signal peptidase II